MSKAKPVKDDFAAEVIMTVYLRPDAKAKFPDPAAVMHMADDMIVIRPCNADGEPESGGVLTQRENLCFTPQKFWQYYQESKPSVADGPHS